MSEHQNLPPAFVKRMKSLPGIDFDSFLQSLNTTPPTSIRLNPFKPTNAFEHEEVIPWCANGRYLQERPSFTFDPLFHAGAYYVQEASSMFIEQACKEINPGHGIRVLDLCAAPGGKSTHLLSLISSDSLLVCNELIPNRNKILQQNIIKWGSPNCIITQNKTSDFGALANYFDVILVDAPCSGEGLFRKDKEAIDEWSEKNVAMCATRQEEILKDAVNCLKPGGYLIYSTCTYEPVENDEHISLLQELDMTPVHLRNDYNSLGITFTQYGYQFYPHKAKGEGFYITLLQKQGINTPRNKETQVKTKTSVASSFLEKPEQFTFYEKNGMIFAIPHHISSDFSFLEKHLYIRNAGICMGSIKGKDFLPSPDLALNIAAKKDLPAIELTLEDAITYLRSETIKTNTVLRGWVIVTYKGLNLGWVKVMDGRVNNYYPKEWRILKK